jgi:hypothetical protein
MVTEERVANLETALTTFIEQSNRVVAANREDIAEIRAAVAKIRVSNARTDRQLLEMWRQAERERKQFNQRLAEISDSRGTSEKLYGIAMGDEVMEVVNLGQF